MYFRFILVALIIQNASFTNGQDDPECLTAIVCVTRTTFVFCSRQESNNSPVLSEVIPCPNGLLCTSDPLVPCIQGPSTTAGSTTAGETTGTGCMETKPTTTELTSTTLAEISTTLTQTTTTPAQTTTTLAQSTTTVGPPVCTQNGNHPAPNCNQFYRCVHVMWWYEIVLTTCPSGQAFDVKTTQCVSNANTTCRL